MACLDSFWLKSETDPFVWGQTDCLMWCASYVEAVAGVDPAIEYRGSYNTSWGARCLVINAGGMVGLVSKVLYGFQVGETQNGIAVIDNKGKRAGAILVDGVAWLKDEAGVCSIVNPKIIKGWNICQAL